MFNNQQQTTNNSALSLILTLLIIGSILTGAVLVGDIIIRHSKTVKGTEISEIAFFAAETAIDKAAYQALKNYTDISNYTLSGTLPNSGGVYSIASGGIAVDNDCPNPPTGCTSGDIYETTNPWEITLSADQSFRLDLDINSSATIYPTSLTISKSGSEPSDLIIYECTTGGTPRECTSGYSQNFSVSFGNPITISASTKYYKIRINNNGDASETYTLDPAGGSSSLPIGIDISSTGTYSSYERQLKTNVPKWQTFGS